MTPPRELLEYLSRYDLGIVDLVLTVREFVLHEVAPPHEYILNVYTVVMGFGPTEKVGDQVCAITVNARYVNLMFHKGTELDDPHSLLEGTGKKVRHVKIRSAADLSHPGIRELLATAWEHAGLTAADRSPDGEVSSRIAATSAKTAVRPNGKARR
ncbi:MAG: DUF1801 domain-containing protein [Pyrinomonadaceae bacterium]